MWPSKTDEKGGSIKSQNYHQLNQSITLLELGQTHYQNSTSSLARAFIYMYTRDWCDKAKIVM
jgi:uncharacterized protein YbcV (DUF1398 family)